MGVGRIYSTSVNESGVGEVEDIVNCDDYKEDEVTFIQITRDNTRYLIRSIIQMSLYVLCGEGNKGSELVIKTLRRKGTKSVVRKD